MMWEKIKRLEERLYELRKEIEEVEKELEGYPSGHLEVKTINGNVYYYLRYWEDGKLRSKYVGKFANEIKEKLSKGEQLRRRLTQLKEEEKKLSIIINKIEKIITDY
ncbi:hypothetical protein SULI_00020 [Saccharolobus solfataricus]|nr:hypothetical protein [Saccharolobus solfataricus]AKA72461.1 hypothetical protein SULB_0004 [Saccharolobus solfataricus]AKA75161.1 hypothetical protein SULC_0003 [Saccharolobus solfataricus]AKA77853.1 hypothetical protein SULA_0003 [Saccharolobus solfataricus]AZF66974.1 hypothetical protein SULG_00020 [Saccharolobus solfataricus]AZF69594.1 hypothetical protein SULH_00020 [Saccharolobus solfataricus]